MSPMPSRIRRLGRIARRPPEPHPELVTLTPEDRRYLTSFYDDSVPLPDGASEQLVEDNPRLRELRAAYAELDTTDRVALVSHRLLLTAP